MNQTIVERQIKDKEALLAQFKKTPIVQVACEKTGIGRTTYYRWRKEDKEFAEKADEALLDGSTLVNDMAESQLINAIRERNLTAIIFWLKHHHKAYATKVELELHKTVPEELTPEQAKAVQQAIEMAGLSSLSSITKTNDAT